MKLSDTPRPGHYVATEDRCRPGVVLWTGDHWRNAYDNRMPDPRTLGYTIHSLEGLLAQASEIKWLRERLAEEIRWGHKDCTPGNCTSSGVECPATPQGEEVAG